MAVGRNLTGILMLAVFAACSAQEASRSTEVVSTLPPGLELIREFPGQHLGGVAISHDDRTFVCFTRFSEPHPMSLAELRRDGTLAAYPDDSWNAPELPSRAEAGSRLISAEAIWVDEANVLWVLDAASPGGHGVVPGGAKLVSFDLDTGASRVYPLGAGVAPERSYLSEVRIDHETSTAFVTDAGLGALVVLDLVTGQARRVLAGHPSVRAEPGMAPAAGRWSGEVAQRRVHANGLALDAARHRLYYRALSARHLWAVDTRLLSDPQLADEIVAEHVEDLGETVVSDALLTDHRGELYLSAIEARAIVVRRLDGTTETVVAAPQIGCPENLAWGRGQTLYLTSSPLGLLAQDIDTEEIARLFRFRLPGADVPAMPLIPPMPMPTPYQDPFDGGPVIRLARLSR